MDKKRKLILIAIGLIVFCVVIPRIITSDNVHGNKLEMKYYKESDKSSTLIKNAAIIFDGSGSMQGYLKSTDYTNVIANVLSKSDSIDIYIGNKYKGQKHMPKVEECLNNNDFKNSNTNLYSLIDKSCSLLNESQKYKYVALVSDMILSNKDSGTSNSNLSTTLINLRNKGYEFAFIQYESDFNGDYYYDKNNNRDYKKSTLKHRPFYVMIFGHKETIESLFADKNAMFCKNIKNVFVTFDVSCDSICKGRVEDSSDTWQCEDKSDTAADNRVLTIFTSGDYKNAETTVNLRLEDEFDVPVFLNAQQKWSVIGYGAVDNVEVIDKKNYNITLKQFDQILDSDKVKVEVVCDNVGNKWMDECSIDDDSKGKEDELERKTYNLSALKTQFDQLDIVSEGVLATIEFYVLKENN